MKLISFVPKLHTLVGAYAQLAGEEIVYCDARPRLARGCRGSLLDNMGLVKFVFAALAFSLLSQRRQLTIVTRSGLARVQLPAP